jgi:hypothetical protein
VVAQQGSRSTVSHGMKRCQQALMSLQWLDACLHSHAWLYTAQKDWGSVYGQTISHTNMLRRQCSGFLNC